MTYEDFTDLGLLLCNRVDLHARQLYRWVGTGLSNFETDEASDFESSNSH